MHVVEVQMAVPGLTYRQLDYWVRTGVIRADQDAPGSGHPRTIPDSEVEVLKTMLPLVIEGLTPRRAGEVARAVLAGETVTIGGLTLAQAVTA